MPRSEWSTSASSFRLSFKNLRPRPVRDVFSIQPAPLDYRRRLRPLGFRRHRVMIKRHRESLNYRFAWLAN